MTQVETEHHIHHNFPHVERRNTLPEPIEKEKSVSLWSMIKDNVGKDLTCVCLPVHFNEPLSSLQKCFEELEYSSLLDRAYEYGKMGNSLMRILNVAAFAVSGYASSDGRHRKPFNPLFGETYEAEYSEKGIRFFSEKSRKLQDNGWKPRWFQKDSKDGTFHYVGGYWEAREQRRWNGCLHIFGELSVVSASNSSMFQE